MSSDFSLQVLWVCLPLKKCENILINELYDLSWLSFLSTISGWMQWFLSLVRSRISSEEKRWWRLRRSGQIPSQKLEVTWTEWTKKTDSSAEKSVFCCECLWTWVILIQLFSIKLCRFVLQEPKLAPVPPLKSAVPSPIAAVCPLCLFFLLSQCGAMAESRMWDCEVLGLKLSCANWIFP